MEYNKLQKVVLELKDPNDKSELYNYKNRKCIDSKIGFIGGFAGACMGIKLDYLEMLSIVTFLESEAEGRFIDSEHGENTYEYHFKNLGKF